jgi:N-formylglutamate deformylase
MGESDAMRDTPPVLVHEPTAPASPIVLDSPHSGMHWPADFRPAASREAIHTTWDAFVDELWGEAPAAGATLIAATFPRAYVDVNRAEDDIDPALLAEPWPTPLAPTPYSQRGMGLIRRHALPDVPMYATPLGVAEVARRIETYYRPYRRTLAARLDVLHAAFGAVWHIDCHSMKSRGNAMNVDAGAARPDVVVSDRHGTTSDPVYTAWVADWLRDQGLSVQVNTPYQGGDLVRTFGAPAAGRHSIQVELNRACYMNEVTFERGPRFGDMRTMLGALVREFAAHVSAHAAGERAP